MFLLYRLSGAAAVKSKNVCLQLVDKHTSFTNSGVVQLFNYPHPQKIVPSPYWSKIAPRFCLSNVKSSPSMLINTKNLTFNYLID